jgi:hypothetical protein
VRVEFIGEFKVYENVGVPGQSMFLGREFLFNAILLLVDQFKV